MAGCSNTTSADFQFLVSISIVNTIAMFCFQRKREKISKNREKGKHDKFDSLWQGPYIIQATVGPNAFFLQELDGTELFGGPVNGRMLKHYFC